MCNENVMKRSIGIRKSHGGVSLSFTHSQGGWLYMSSLFLIISSENMTTSVYVQLPVERSEEDEDIV